MPSSPSPVIINNQGDNTTTVSNTSMDLTTILSIVFGVVSICAISFILYLYYQRNIHDKQKQSNPKSKGLENTKSINHSIAISKVSGNEINSNGKGLQKNEHKKDTFISNDNQKNEYRRKGKDEVLVIEHTDASQGEKSSKENQVFF